MFEIGFWELVLVGVVAMIVVGPERLPGVARTTGLWLGKARRMIAEVKAEVDRELHLEEIKQSFRDQSHLTEISDMKNELANRVKTLQQEIQEELDDPGPPPGWKPGILLTPPPDKTIPAPPQFPPNPL